MSVYDLSAILHAYNEVAQVFTSTPDEQFVRETGDMRIMLQSRKITFTALLPVPPAAELVNSLRMYLLANGWHLITINETSTTVYYGYQQEPNLKQSWSLVLGG
jgi:hypothetical protein